MTRAPRVAEPARPPPAQPSITSSLVSRMHERRCVNGSVRASRSATRAAFRQRPEKGGPLGLGDERCRVRGAEHDDPRPNRTLLDRTRSVRPGWEQARRSRGVEPPNEMQAARRRRDRRSRRHVSATAAESAGTSRQTLPDSTLAMDRPSGASWNRTSSPNTRRGSSRTISSRGGRTLNPPVARTPGRSSSARPLRPG